MKNYAVYCLLLSCLCSGCIGNQGLRSEAASETNASRLIHVEKGMSQSQVFAVMRNPYSYETFHVGDDVYDIWFYVTRAAGLGQTRMVPQNLTPLTFKNGVLVGTGYNWYHYAMNEEVKQNRAPEEPLHRDDEENKEIENALKPLSSQAEPIAQTPTAQQSSPSGPVRFMKPWKPVLGAKKIEVSKIQIGMTEAEVTRMLGTPARMETYRIRDDLYEIWFYEIATSKKQMPLTFKNGVLVNKTPEFYQQIKNGASKEAINGYDREAEDMEQQESDQNFNYW